MKKRRKKLNITPGKSVSAEDITDVSNSPKVAITRAEKDVADEAMNLQDEEEASTGTESVESAENSATGTGFDNPDNLMAKGENISVEDFVTVKYEGQKFPGKVISIEKDGPLVSALTKCKKNGWRWPQKKDCFAYNWEDVEKMKEKEIPLNNRGFYRFPDLEEEWGK